MTQLSAPRLLAVATAAVLAVIAVLLPWVSAPLGFRQLQTRGIDTGYGQLAAVVGVLLLLDAAVTLVRGRRLLGRWPLLVVAVVLALLAARGWADVRNVLDRDVPGIGVHPGRRGPGLVVLWFSVVAGVVAVGLAFRDAASAPGARTTQRDRSDDE
jgi:hypothetical protein